ncbi:MAG: hypothetical protein ACTSUB_07925 [Candidatus Thorarchaeota archaeon]
MAPTRRRSLFILISMLTVLSFIVNSEPVWESSSIATAIYSILAFLMITVSAGAINRIRTDPTLAHRMFLSGTGYASIVFTGAAIYYQIFRDSIPVHTSTAGITLNLLAFATTGLILFISTWLERHPQRNESIFNHRLLPSLIVIFSSSIFAICVVVFRFTIDNLVFLIFGYALGSIAFVTFFLSAIMKFKQEHSLETHDSFRLSIAYILLATATLVHVFILPDPSYLWMLSMGLLGVSFIFAVFGTVYPYLVNIGVTSKISYNVTLLLCVMVLVPFLVAIVAVVWLPVNILENAAASIIIHLGASLLAGSTAYTMSRRYRYPRGSYHTMIIFILLFWTVVESAVVFSNFLPSFGISFDSVVPYIVGMSVSSVLLLIAVRRRLSPVKEDLGQMPDRNYILGSIGFIFAIVVGEFLSRGLSNLIPSYFNDALGSSLMLLFSYISLFALLNLILVTSATEGDRLSFHTVISGLAASWIVVTVLKANFEIWTIGYWASEVLLLCAFLVFPLILIRLYLSENRKATEIDTRASRYSEFLSRHITTHHSSAIESIGKLSKGSVSDDVRLDAVGKALAEISRADEMSRYLKLLLSGGSFTAAELETRDLVNCIRTGIDKVPNECAHLLKILTVDRNPGECFVIANCLLPDVFQNIFTGISSRIGFIQSIDVDLTSTVVNLQTMWTTRLQVKVETNDPEMKSQLFHRYTKGDDSEAIEFAYAKRIVQLFRGIIMSESASEENTVSIEFVIKLPLIKET